jgi:hypothetical protein
MRRIAVVVIYVSVIVIQLNAKAANCQTTPQATRSEDNRIVAAVLMGAGIGVMTTGLVLSNNVVSGKNEYGRLEHFNTDKLIFTGGVLTALGGLFYALSAGTNDENKESSNEQSYSDPDTGDWRVAVCRGEDAGWAVSFRTAF